MKLYVSSMAAKAQFGDVQKAELTGNKLRLSTPPTDGHATQPAVSIVEIEDEDERDWLISKLQGLTFDVPIPSTILV